MAKMRVCHFWGSNDGCRLGAGCRYQHDWDSITDKMGRCWQCSSKNHMKSACPTLKDGGQPRLPVGGSDREEKGKGKGKKGLRKGDGLKESSDNKGEEDKEKTILESSIVFQHNGNKSAAVCCTYRRWHRNENKWQQFWGRHGWSCNSQPRRIGQRSHQPA